MATEAEVPLLGGASVKAALDRDWDDLVARDQALGVVLEALEQVEGLVAHHQLGSPGVQGVQGVQGALEALGAARQVRDQDVQVADGQPPTLRRGVARDRRICIEDPQMRHGRKSRSHLIDGYKRHVLRDLDSGLVPAVAVTAANLPEAHGATQIRDDLAAQQLTLAEVFIDRAYLSSVLVQERSEGLEIFCKAWPVHNGPRFAKTDFTLDFEHHLLVCPAGQQMPFVPGGPVPRPDLRRLPAAHPVHHQQPRAQRADPRRRAAAGRAAPAAAHPVGAGQAARADRGRAHPGPHRLLARPSRPLPGRA